MQNNSNKEISSSGLQIGSCKKTIIKKLVALVWNLGVGGGGEGLEGKGGGCKNLFKFFPVLVYKFYTFIFKCLPLN